MRSVYGGSSDGVPWWRVALGYARVIARDTYARGVALAIAAWIAARWQVPGAVQWVDTAWALLAALLGAGLAVERVRSGAAAAALDELMSAPLGALLEGGAKSCRMKGPRRPQRRMVLYIEKRGGDRWAHELECGHTVSLVSPQWGRLKCLLCASGRVQRATPPFCRRRRY